MRTRSGPGDIFAVAGLADVTIGETLADPDDPRPLPVLTVDEPSLSMTIGINTSPLPGREGTKLTARLLKNRLDAELVGNVSLRVFTTERPDAWEVQGRGELQLAVLVEVLRREGFEVTVGKPQVVTRLIDGKVHEPVEHVSIDVPEDYLGVVTQLVAVRKGRLEQMVNHGTGWARLEYLVPARALIGFRTEFLTDTRGTGILAPCVRGFRAVVRRPANAADGLARGRPLRRDDDVLVVQPAGSGPAVRGSRRGGLRGHDHRRERPVGGHGREPDQGAQSHERALVYGRRARAAHPATAAVARAGAGVHP